MVVCIIHMWKHYAFLKQLILIYLLRVNIEEPVDGQGKKVILVWPAVGSEAKPLNESTHSPSIPRHTHTHTRFRKYLRTWVNYFRWTSGPFKYCGTSRKSVSRKSTPFGNMKILSMQIHLALPLNISIEYKTVTCKNYKYIFKPFVFKIHSDLLFYNTKTLLKVAT